MQLPQVATVRVAPQLSSAVREPQFFESREQKVGSSSGTQAHTLEPLQTSTPVQVPHEVAVRVVPQLSGAVTAPQFFPSREQNSVSVSGAQAHTFEPPQV